MVKKLRLFAKLDRWAIISTARYLNRYRTFFFGSSSFDPPAHNNALSARPWRRERAGDESSPGLAPRGVGAPVCPEDAAA